MAYLLWFNQIKKEDVELVGGKSASLGEMTSKTSVPVPYGFATTAEAYRYFLKASGVEKTIENLTAKLTDVEDTVQLKEVCAEIRNSIMQAEMPADLAAEIGKAYEELAVKVGEPQPFVAVRSSATAEDLPDASFAGQQDTYLNVLGAQEVIERVKECYASTFTDRAVYYRTKKGFPHLDVALSAVIQMMVFSKSAGVMFTVDIATGNDKDIFIEAGWGLGEYVVQGTVTPDSYLVSKDNLEIKNIFVSDKPLMLVRKPGGGCEEQRVPQDKARAQVLTEEQVKELAAHAKTIEAHYGCYMDIEWGVDERTNKIWILQARPETVWSRRTEKEKAELLGTAPNKQTTEKKVVVVKGLPASPGKVAGRARVILDPNRINEFQDGEILVTEMTAPDWVPAMKKAKAIVTDSGGMTCHASIVSRELGIPCIVGTKSRGEACTVNIKDGMMITVDATHGIVYEGILEETKKEIPAQTMQVAETFPVTGTKIYMNLGDPDLAEKYCQLPCDGIGLMREEFIWTTYIHEHPLYMIETGRADKVVESLADGIQKVCQAMSPRPVVLRFSDFKSSEYRDLKGGDKYEPHEPSALLGWRGASRYYDPKYIEAFKLELAAIKKVREEYGYKNLYVMIPFCRNIDEIKKVTALMAEQGLQRSADFKVWLMAEIPANIILADQFNEYVDGYSIGSNDLTMLVLGCDRDNDTVSHIYDERNLAVKRAIRHLIDVAHKGGKTVSICGQAPSVYPEFAEFLVRSGIDSMSVNPDTVKYTRKMIAQVEQRIMLECLTKRGRVDSEDYTW